MGSWKKGLSFFQTAIPKMVDFTAVLPHDIVQNRIIARLDRPAKTALLRVSKTCFGLTVASVLLSRYMRLKSRTFLRLFGPALRNLHWCEPEHGLGYYVAALERRDAPIRITFNYMTENNPAKDVRLFLSLLDHPKVKELHVHHFRAISEDACSVMAHPKFVAEISEALELGDVPLPPACRAKLAADSTLHKLVLRPLRVHHLDAIDLLPSCEDMNIFPQGADASVLASAARLARAVRETDYLKFVYETEADVRLLSAILEEHAGYNALTIRRSTRKKATCSPAAEQQFLAALRSISVDDDIDVSLDAEIANPEQAIEALAFAFDNNCSPDCRIRITCCTPRECALLRVNTKPEAQFTLLTTPRADGTGPTTDAWMWDAMMRATVRADGDASGLVLYGGCDDNGFGGSNFKARCAGVAMGRTRFTDITVMFRCPDTAWMPHFILGFTLSKRNATRNVSLMAGKVLDGDDFYDENMRPVLRPEVVAAVTAANSAGPTEWQCLEADP